MKSFQDIPHTLKSATRMNVKNMMMPLLFCLALMNMNCSEDDPGKKPPEPPDELTFIFGMDMSFVNQVLDHGGVYKESNVVKDPFVIIDEKGTNLVRIRLWHNPTWTKEVYGVDGTQMYSDLADVAKSIQSAKAQGMKVLLDFHYSDTWADPGNQKAPDAWKNIKDILILEDSVYNYTSKTLAYLEGKSLMPEYVQIGNETNCGFMYSNAPAAFPNCDVCNNNWVNFGKAVNSAIDAIRDASTTSTIKPEIILHVADPKNVTWWFDNVMASDKGNVTDFDIIGFSYYPLWLRTVPVDQISSTIAGFRSKYTRDVIIMETAYPWTTQSEDSYSNHFGNETPISGFPYSIQGQHDMMVKLTQEAIDGGAVGMIYWEPGWISCAMKDLWGTGSSWENSTFFDFDGNVHAGIDFIKYDYQQ
jgi:arabinogalactan endo-1,4-beta-galactosidase